VKKNRFGIVVLVFLLLFLALVARMVQVTLLPDPRLKDHTREITGRGRILDRDGHVLAVSTPFFSLYVRPMILPADKRDAFMSELSATGIFTAAELQQIGQDKPFAWVKRKMLPSQAALLAPLFDAWKRDKRIAHDEFGLTRESGRIYPEIQTAAVVGAVGVDEQGLSGLEYSFNRELSAGQDVQTTLDPQVSSIALEEVRRAVIDNKAEAGSAVVIDAKTGEIIALVNWPSFDPNDLGALRPELLKPAALSDVFEPGSVLKQFSAAFALDRGYATPHYPVYECTGVARIENQTVECVTPHGKVDLAMIIQKSCNVGMLQIADHFPKDDLYSFLHGAGFGDAPAIPLAGLERGIFRPVSEWSVFSKYMVSIGQEIGVTALQLSAASTVVASDGVYKTPVLVRSVGGSSAGLPAREERALLKPGITKVLRSMMENVVSENGTALLARVEGIDIAGKTGTGQVARPDGKGYYDDLYNAVFLGYVPAGEPKLTITVVIHKPRAGKHQGGEVAAPVFASIVRRILVTTPWISAQPEQ
jgi:cell division protein FtsI/penicillin-binding protein 2